MPVSWTQNAAHYMRRAVIRVICLGAVLFALGCAIGVVVAQLANHRVRTHVTQIGDRTSRPSFSGGQVEAGLSGLGGLVRPDRLPRDSTAYAQTYFWSWRREWLGKGLLTRGVEVVTSQRVSYSEALRWAQPPDATVLPASVPTWSVAAEVDPEFGPVDLWSEVRYGWPWPIISSRTMFTEATSEEAKRLTTKYGGVSATGGGLAEGALHRIQLYGGFYSDWYQRWFGHPEGKVGFLSGRVLLGNLLKSGAFYAVLLYLLYRAVAIVPWAWRAPRKLRSWHRLGRGLCGACAYNRRGLTPDAPCPECNAAPPGGRSAREYQTTLRSEPEAR